MIANQSSFNGAGTHKGPPLALVAIVFMVLFCTGLYFVCAIPPKPHFPGPWESAEVISTYFREHPFDVLMCAMFQFGAAVPLCIFTATVASRLRFLGVRAAGVDIAFIGGILTTVNLMVSALVIWVMAY